MLKKTICDLENTHCLAWRWLGAVTLLFLAGYLYTILRLLTEPPHPHDLLLSLILHGGGVFVTLVDPELAFRTIEELGRFSFEPRNAIAKTLIMLPRTECYFALTLPYFSSNKPFTRHGRHTWDAQLS